MFAHFKSVIRRPFQITLLILLLGAVAFGFTARAVEYLVVTHTVDELSEYYRAIGYLSSGNGDVTEGVRLLSESDLVSTNDVQRYCAGTLNSIYNADLDGLSSSKGYNVSEVLLWGELTDKSHFIPKTKLSQEYYTLHFRVVQRLYGYPDYAPEDRYITVTYYPEENDTDWTAAFDVLQVNAIYGIRAYYSGDGGYTFNLLLRRALPGSDWFLTQDDPRAQALPEADAVQEINRHRIILNSTQDMSALPLAQEVNRDGYLIDGRWLTASDNENSNPVCVILQDFAEARGLSVGDTLTVTLSDEQMAYCYYPEGTTLEDTEASDITTTFTIVGIFNRTIFSEGYSSVSTRSLVVYIPDSCMPAEYDASTAALEDNTVYESGYSFVLIEPDVEEAFLQEYRSQLELMGYTITMIENGWTEFSASAFPICQSVTYSAAMFAAVQLLTLLLAGFLYRRQHRREFAIARALGIPARRVVGWHLLPVLLAGIVGVGMGSILAWRYTLGKVQVTLSALISEGQSVNTKLPLWILSVLFLSVLALFLLITFLGYITMSRHPVMDILHEVHKNQGPQKMDKATVTAAAVGNVPLVRTKMTEWDVPSFTTSALKGTSGLVLFTRRHVCRSKGNAVLILSVAIIFILALAWIQEAIQQTDKLIDELYSNISVEAEILKSVSGSYTSEPGFIAGTAVDDIMDTGFVQESSLVAAATDADLMRVDGNNNMDSSFTLCGITNADILNQETAPGMMVTGGDGEIAYQIGWNDSMFNQDYDNSMEWYPIVVSESMLETLNVRLGNQLLLGTKNRGVTAVIVGSYTGQFNGLGNITGEAVLMPLTLMQELYGGDLYYSVAEFSIDRTLNRDLDTFRTTIEQIMKSDRKSRLTLNLVIWDEELRMVVQPMEKNLTLMQALYPIVLAVSFLAAGAVALLLLLQEVKTVAILRVLGISTCAVRMIFGIEQLFLGLVGVVIGILAAVALGKGNVQLPLCAVVYLLGLTVGTAAGCIAITRKKPLELLQVKE